MKYAGLVVANLLRNKRRMALTSASIAVSLFMMTRLITILTAMEASTESDGSELRLITRSKVSLANLLPESHWQKIARVAHVETVCPTSWFGGVYVDDRNFFPQFAVDPPSYLALVGTQRKFKVEAGDARAWARDRRGAMVHADLAAKYGWKVGDVFTIQGRIYPFNPELEVDAIYSGDDPAIYFDRKYLDEALGGVGRAGSYWVRVDRPENLPRVARAIDALFANSDAETLTETEKAFQAGFISMLGNVKGFVVQLSLVIAVVILIVTGSSVAMSVRERVTEVAVMKALGFPRETILALLLAEAVLLAVLGGIFGVGGFWGLSVLIFDVLGFKLPNLWFTLVPPWWLAVGLIASTVGLGLSAGILPAWFASRKPILEGLRQA